MTGPGVSAQTADKPQASDSSKAGTGKAGSFYAGGGYGSNMIYLGSTMSQDNPYGYASVSYGFHNKLFATVSAVHLSAADPLAAFYIGSLSYSHPFNDWFDISAGLYRYQVDPSLTDTLFGSFNYGDLTLGFDWNILYTKISAGALFFRGEPGLLPGQEFKIFPDSGVFQGESQYLIRSLCKPYVRNHHRSHIDLRYS